MASSSIITSINSALDDLDSLVSNSSGLSWKQLFMKQRYRLRNFKTFILCARKLGNDVHQMSNDNKNENGSVGSLLIRVEDVVGSYVLKIHSFLHTYKHANEVSLSTMEEFHSGFETDIQPSMEKIDEWYITMSDYTRQSSFLTTDEIVEINQSISENLLDFPFPNSIEAMEALREHMKFLTNFCRFVSKSGVEHGQIEDLLTHTEAVAINAARLCFLCGADNDDEEWQEGMQLKISIPLQKIKPIDSQVYETYNQALSPKPYGRRGIPET